VDTRAPGGSGVEGIEANVERGNASNSQKRSLQYDAPFVFL
jgi:hypothetical protein